MSNPLAPFIVRIQKADGTIVGGGFLIGEHQILTCAHVVRDALNMRSTPPDPPQDDIHLDFPFIEMEKVIKAKVVSRGWGPCLQNTECGSDIAVLSLSDPPPHGSRPASLNISTADVSDHPFFTYGFPKGYDKGVQADGIVKYEQADQSVQLEDENVTGKRIEGGFSGAPVWDEQLESVIGMISSADRQKETKVAFMIPTQLIINVCPDLRELLDDGKISLQKILQDLSKRMKEITSVYMPVAKYLKRIGKEDIDEDGELFLEVVKNFLYRELSAEDFIEMWQQTDTAPVQPPKEIHYDILAEQLEAGEIIPFLGSEMLHLFGLSASAQQDLTRTLAEKAKYPDFNGSLPMISQYYQMELSRNTLIRTVSEAECASLQPNNLYHLLGNITSPVVVISTYYDNVLETIFREKQKKFVIMSHYMHSKADQDFGKVFLMYSDRSEPEKSLTPEAVSGLNLLEQGYSIIYKICGCFNLCNAEIIGKMDPLIISEDDFFNFSRHLERLIPDYLTREFGRRRLLFFGYNLEEWQDRLVANTILEKKRVHRDRSYTVAGNPSPYEKAYWKFNGVDVYPVELEPFVENLHNAMEELQNEI